MQLPRWHTVTLRLRAGPDVKIQTAYTLLLYAVVHIAVAAYPALTAVHGVVCLITRYSKCHVLIYSIGIITRLSLIHI